MSLVPSATEGLEACWWAPKYEYAVEGTEEDRREKDQSQYKWTPRISEIVFFFFIGLL